MYRSMRTCRFEAGKGREAVELAKAGIAYGLREGDFEGVKAEELLDLLGDANAVDWYI